MKWYIWVIIAIASIVVVYFIFGGKKDSSQSLGSEGNPITNSGSGVSNQHPSAFDWFAGVIAPTLAAGLAVLPSLINKGGDTNPTPEDATPTAP